MKKYIFWINAHTLIEQQSPEDWNIPDHLKNNGPSIKIHLIFWVFIMTFNLCFYHQLWVKWVCIHIGNSSGHSWNACGCLTLNQMHIELTFLIISLINDNLTSNLSIHPQKVKKTVLSIVKLIILCTSTEI